MNGKISNILIVLGIVLIGFSTATVIAQEVEIGENAGTPFVRFNDLTNPGNQYEIRLNDGTGVFQIFDITKSRSVFVINDKGWVGTGNTLDPDQPFTIFCDGICNIQTRAGGGDGVNTVRSLAGGEAVFRLVQNEWVGPGPIRFEIRTDDTGKIQFVDNSALAGLKTILEIDILGANRGEIQFFDRVIDSTGTCVINCP